MTRSGSGLRAAVVSFISGYTYFGISSPQAGMSEVRATFPGPVLLIKAGSALLLVGFLAQNERAPVIDAGAHCKSEASAAV